MQHGLEACLSFWISVGKGMSSITSCLVFMTILQLPNFNQVKMKHPSTLHVMAGHSMLMRYPLPD